MSTPHFWIITLQTPRGISSLRGIRHVEPGETREETFLALSTYASEQIHCATPAVLFFSLEPNIPGGAM